MTMHKRIHQIFSGILISILFILMVSCSGKGNSLGAQIPDNVSKVKLADIVSSPDQFNGKTVVMEGIVSGQCPSLCEFFFKDGMHTATIFPQGFKFPKLDTGKKVTVYAQVTAGKEQVVFSALGLRLEQEKS